jgi:peptidoglycan/LPS O-acetylase OafA/YrhL
VQHTGAELPTLGYRPALDGVRAIAILAVLAFHSGALRGGFIGVDIFFVLSGFLITTLLLQEWRETGRIRFADFYRRRAARLLPALFVTIAAVAVIYEVSSSFGLHTDRGFAGIAAAVLFYSGNWIIALSQGNIPFGLLAHTWSLAIEEQFYLVWPVLLLLLLSLSRRKNLRPLLAIALTLAVASALLRFVLWNAHTGGNIYFRTDTRADGLLLGCALAVVYSTGSGRAVLARYAGRQTIAVLAVTAMAFFALSMTPRADLLYDGGLFAVALAAATTIAHIVSAQQSLPTRILASVPFVWIGA